MIQTPSNDHCTCCEVIGENPNCPLHPHCPECGGQGFVRAARRATGYVECEYCNGSGLVAPSDEQPPTFDDSQVICDYCGNCFFGPYRAYPVRDGICDLCRLCGEGDAKADQSPKGEDPKGLSSRERRSRRDLPE